MGFYRADCREILGLEFLLSTSAKKIEVCLKYDQNLPVLYIEDFRQVVIISGGITGGLRNLLRNVVQKRKYILCQIIFLPENHVRLCGSYPKVRKIQRDCRLKKRGTKGIRFSCRLIKARIRTQQ